LLSVREAFLHMFSSIPLQEEGASNHGRDRRSRGNAVGAAGMPRAGMGARVPHHLARPARQWQGDAVLLYAWNHLSVEGRPSRGRTKSGFES
jgi:hypothetical protein